MKNNFYEYEQEKHDLKQLKVDAMGRWIEREWIPKHPEQALHTLWTSDECIHQEVLTRFDKKKGLAGKYNFNGYKPIDNAATVAITAYSYMGSLTYRTGTYLYEFILSETNQTVDILVMSSYWSDDGDIVTLVCVPQEFTETWMDFAKECNRLSGSLEPRSEVIIVGGRNHSFVPSVEWEDIILPEQLKTDIMEDVKSFFTKGISIYKRLNLKPFRKLLLAGVPGTGKTMLCAALAKWAIEREYLVIYVSSADRDGSRFWKIQEALAVASRSELPTLILLEELDAYLHEEEKALVLNVLDGSESLTNEKGSLLIATTNYPEAIDERVLKRPGRLDRIFIVPETRTNEDAEKMLKKYLGDMWRDDHKDVAKELVGYPGAFIREVAIYALTHVAYEDLSELSLELLQKSYNRLKEQIEARDDFLSQRLEMGFGI
jgi:hypothetical protein